jgi:alginate O-acetyltransferase complex protein AlgI
MSEATILSLSNKRFQFKISPILWSILLLAGIFMLIIISHKFTQPQFEVGTTSLKKEALPYHLNLSTSSNLLIKIPGNVTHDIMALDFIASERPQIMIKQKNINFYKINNMQCHHLDNKYYCKVPFDRDNAETVIKLTTLAENTYIDNMTLRLLKSTSNPLDGTKPLFPLFMLIAISVPIIWALHHRRVLSQYLIIGLSILCLIWVQPIFTCILLTYLYAIYRLGMKMQQARQNKALGRNRTLMLYTGLITSIAFLFLWKYGVRVIADIFANPGGFSIVMPLGISYFIIRLIDTVLRWYRAEVRHTSFREFLCFVIFPATIPAGPIDTIDNFMSKRLDIISKEDIAYGLSRILLGAAKKILLVGFILKNIIFGGETSLYNQVLLAPELALTQDVLLLPFLMMLYAYFDFSAYSDIAIGLSRLMGYKMVENFNWPIFSKNIQEFWKRWHMSLSGWCMRNIYMPTTIKTRSSIIPLYITMLTVGLWHSFNLSWFTWAMHHSTGLTLFTHIERRKYLVNNQWIKTILIFFKIPLTLIFVASGYYFAFVTDFTTAWSGYLRFWRSFIP